MVVKKKIDHCLSLKLQAKIENIKKINGNIIYPNNHRQK